jgi:hypothetical protein
MPVAKFALGPDPVHPGLQTILADRGDGYKPARLGKFSDVENAAQIKRLEKQGIAVKALRRAS